MHIVLLTANVLQFCQSKPAVVEWYLKKQNKDKAPDKINQNVRAFRAKHAKTDNTHEKEWEDAVAEVKGDEAPNKRKYGKKTPYTPAAKPARKEMESKKEGTQKATPVVAKTQKQHKFEVKSVTKPVTTAAANSIASLHDTAHLNSGMKAKSVKSGSKDQAHKVHKKQHAGPAAGPAGAPGMGPAPAPAPAPLNYEQRVSKLKGDMMNKIKGDSFDADFVIERPNKVLPGKSTGTEVPVPEFKDVGGDFGPYAPAAAPLKHDDISFKTGSLPKDSAHVNRETMTSDWHMEYGPNGPKGTHGTTPTLGTSFQPLQVR